MVDFNLLEQLVAIDSWARDGTNQKAADIISILKERLDKEGLESSEVEEGGFKSIYTIGNRPRILILTHVDVVQSDDKQFVLDRKRDDLFGRGTADMKGGLVAALSAFLRVKRADVVFAATSDEEIGGFNGARLLAERLKPDFVIAPESTDLDITVANKGVMTLNLTATGKEAHSSRPWLGENAIEKLFLCSELIGHIDLLQKGNSLFQPVNRSTANLSQIKGGQASNKVPGECEAVVDIRFIPDVDPKQLLDEVRSICNQVGVSFKLRNDRYEPAVSPNSFSPYVSRLARIIEEKTNRKPTLKGTHGASDSRFFKERGADVAEFGPGLSDTIHTPEEHTTAEDLAACEQILTQFLLEV